MSDLSKPYNPQEVEEGIYKKWEASGYFNPDNLKGADKPYAIHLPPPNVTGSLHIGHALNATISDALIRYYRMKGRKAVWFPGTDHAGIATQNVVEKQLKKEGVSRWDLGRENFIKRVWEWKKEYGDIIINQLKKMGASCDWSRLRFTMDENYAEWVKKAFVHYFERGWIYRGTRVVSWCPHCQTSLSDLEIEHKEAKTNLWHIKYPIKNSDGDFIVVATTRPETMLGDTAVAVNPKDARYKDLVGKTVIVPIINREVPIVADNAIEIDFGTGAVKVTPAHDLLDAEIGERHKLEAIQVIDEKAKMTAAAGRLCEGLKYSECRERVVEELKKLGLIEKIEEHNHNIGVCYRCGTEIQPILSLQWFLKMNELATKALTAVKDEQVKIKPNNFEIIYTNWLENIRDWTISRQIWWGHRLPVWFHENKCVPKPGKESEVGQCREMIVSATEPKCQHCEAKFIQSEDVLDTWFSSALWPFAGLSDDDVKNFYPSNVLITDRGIINLWVARMIFSGLEFQGSLPFPNVLIHATVLTKEGQRMSKSLGTGIDPLKLIERYGADATRFGIIWQAMGGQDIRWDETAVMAGKKFANKLWNVARFIIDRTAEEDFNEDGQEIGKAAIVAKLEEVKKNFESNFEKYLLSQALHYVYDFVWHDLADKYLEESKKILEGTDEQQKKLTRAALAHCLKESLKLLHPFMPFITEEIYQKMPIKSKGLLMIENW